jgi:hypothetical protein
MVLAEGKYKLEIQYVGTVYGKVMRYGLLSTVIKTNDGVLVHVPNRDMNIMAVTNMSLNDTIRVTVRFHINKNADIIDIRSKDAIYSTPGVCEQSQSRYGSVTYWKQTFSDMQWFTSTKICRKLNWILHQRILDSSKVSVVSEGYRRKKTNP